MAPRTPKKKTERREYDTVKRMRFFQAWDLKDEADGVGIIAKLPRIDIPTSTGRSWLKLRNLIGDQALRSQRKSSSILGRKAKVSASDLDRLTDQNESIHKKGWTEQAKTIENRPSKRTLQRHTHAAGAQQFKKRYQTPISKKNQPLRRQYGQEHKKKTVYKFWSFIWFTDEAHFQSRALADEPEYDLRYPGQEPGFNAPDHSGIDVTVHVAGSCSYNHKGKLIFYKDPAEPSQRVCRQIKQPKQLKYELDSAYQERLKVWEDTKAKELETPKGNCMSHIFYAKNILPEHIKQIQALEAKYKVKYYLQEDGDPSHGVNSPNSAPAQLKRDANLLLLIHPAQSPDLNPMEACWNIMKGRLAGRKWSTVAQFKADIQAEWDKITLTQIRQRIREMPNRCKLVQEEPARRIASDLW